MIKKTLLCQVRCSCCHVNVNIYKEDDPFSFKKNENELFCSNICYKNYDKGKKIRRCWECKKFKPNSRMCGRCKIPFYCSRTCQKMNWNKFHKKQCDKLKEPTKLKYILDDIINAKGTEEEKLDILNKRDEELEKDIVFINKMFPVEEPLSSSKEIFEQFEKTKTNSESKLLITLENVVGKYAMKKWRELYYFKKKLKKKIKSKHKITT